METANWLLFIGILYTLLGASMIISPEVLRAALKEIPHNKAATLGLGLLSLMLGAAILSTHFKWGGIGEILVTFIGIAAVVEGFIYATYPNVIKHYKPWFKQENHIQAVGFFCLFFGVGILTALLRV
jgi:uncharacterized protein YjeT (DUF2065 family)